MDDVYGREGFALEIYGLYGISPSGSQIEEGDNNVRVTDGWGPGFRFEYRRSRLFGFEAIVENLKREIQGRDQPSDIATWTMFGAARFYMAAGRMQPYFVAGVGATFADEVVDFAPVNITEVAYRVGGGLDFYFTKHFVFDFSIEHTMFGSQLSGSDYLKLGMGAKYRF